MSQEILFSEQHIEAYDPFRAQLKELKEGNDKVVFDYESEKGNKEARSHVFKLRKTKTAVDKVRKEQKDASLQFGRRVDSQAKDIIVEIEEMIEVHDAPIKAIEQREKDRIAKHQENMDCLQRFLDHDFTGEPVNTIDHHMASLSQFSPDASYDEFMAPATKIFQEAMEKATSALAYRKNYDAEQAELEKLRAEKEERERKEREDRIAQEAAAKAKAEAEQKAEAARKESERKEQEAKAAAQAAEDARIKAEAKAKQDAIDSEERQKAAVKAAEDKAMQDAENARIAEEEAAKAREADKKNRAAVNNAAVNALVAEGMAQTAAKQAVTIIAQRKVPSISITY